jgi:hypothetical protein
MLKQWVSLSVAMVAVVSAALGADSAAAQSSKGNDLSVKLYGENAKAEKKEKAEAPAKEAEEPPASNTIIRCVNNGRVTFTNTKCEGGAAQAAAVRGAQPPSNQLTRSGASGATPKPLAALTPLYETVQASSGTAGYELREQCDKIDSQLSRLDAQAQLALPKAEPETNRKKREELLRKRHALRCG